MPEEPAKLDETLDAKPYESPKPRPLRRTLLAVLSVSVLLLTLGSWSWFGMGKPRRDLKASEACAISNLRDYVKAQRKYHVRDRAIDQTPGLPKYAESFCLLQAVEEPAPSTAALIDHSWSVPPEDPRKRGYHFREMETIAYQAMEWDKDFTLCAMPAEYNRTGRRVFIVKTDGTIWGKDLGRSKFVADFPADPVGEGWQRVE